MNDLKSLESRIETCLAELPPQGEELVRLLMTFYGDGLYRMLELIHELTGNTVIDELGRDPRVSALMILHDLHPLPLEERVRLALDSVRPQLGSHGGDVSLVEINQDCVTLSLEGSCDGCPASQATLRQLIGRALEQAAPELTAIRLDGSTPTAPGKYEVCPR